MLDQQAAQIVDGARNGEHLLGWDLPQCFLGFGVNNANNYAPGTLVEAELDANSALPQRIVRLLDRLAHRFGSFGSFSGGDRLALLDSNRLDSNRLACWPGLLYRTG